MDPADDPSIHRLEGSGTETGGLVLKKKDKNSDATTFKIPKPSLLGLDRLAAEKRKEREESKRLISFKDSEYDDISASPRSELHSSETTSSSLRTPDLSSVHKLNRQFREQQDETPSHSGGVSDTARNRLAERNEKDRRGMHVSSKDDRKRRSDDDDRKRDRSFNDYRGRDRDRGIDRNRDRDRDRGRGRDRDRNKERNKDRRSDRSDRYGRSESERSLHTPRFKDEPRTPRSGKFSTTASTSWDDDDEKAPAKRSAWDFPTPKDSDSKRSEWSTRSSTSSIYRLKNNSKYADDTPRPTPAHKYNAWANDRKRSGATPQTGDAPNILCFLFSDYSL